MRILLLGHTGTLGRELQKCDPTIKTLGSNFRIDLYSYQLLRNALIKEAPDMIINCAARIDNREIEKDPEDAIKTNIIGASNVALICNELGIRYVYISTDYVYNGKRSGHHSENDSVLPENLYAWTKLGGECSARCVKNHLIIRTSFGKNKFPYQQAFTNQFTSKDYVDVIAPMILKAAHANTQGVINIGTGKKSLYNYAIKRNPTIKNTEAEFRDFSLDLKKYNYEIG